MIAELLCSNSQLISYSFLFYNSQPSNVWFNRAAISKSAPEEQASVDSMCQEIEKLLKKEVDVGIPYNRIVVGGFSMGGALAFHMAYRHSTLLAGCCAMSSFLNDNSLVYKVRENF